MVLMLAGAVALAWAPAGERRHPEEPILSGRLLVLIGIVAMTRNHIRGFARSPQARCRCSEAASDLRLLLLYTGAAWGAAPSWSCRTCRRRRWFLPLPPAPAWPAP